MGWNSDHPNWRKQNNKKDIFKGALPLSTYAGRTTRSDALARLCLHDARKRTGASSSPPFAVATLKTKTWYINQSAKHDNCKIEGKKVSRRGSPKFLTALYSF